MWPCNPNQVPENEEWWISHDSSLCYSEPQPHSLYAMGCGSRAPYGDTTMDQSYWLPHQGDTANTNLVPLSPSFSPLPFGAALDENACWPENSESRLYSNDPLLQSPQWSGIPTPHFWNGMTGPPGFEGSDVSSYTYSHTSSYNSPISLPRPSSPVPSDSSGRLSPISVFSASASSSRRSSIDSSSSVKSCSHCAATTTPLWRRSPATRQPLCNACGLYLQQRHKLRPLALIVADQEEDLAHLTGAPLDDFDGPECSHCHARKTSVWRRSKTGAKLCNACGVYARLRGRDRPLTLRRNSIRPRCKHTK